MSVTLYLQSRGFHVFEGNCQELYEQVNDLIELTKRPSIKVLVIGFNAGHSAEVFLKNNPTLTLTSFCLGNHDYVHPAKDYIDSQFPNRHTLILGDSRVTIPRFFEENKHITFDFIFVDGGHDYEVAKADLENCFQLAHENTIVALDDTVFTPQWEAEYTTGPTKTWEEHLEQNKIVEVNRKDYNPGRGMSWGKYIKNKKVVDCFIFYNELDLLTYRLNLLNDVVDYFVIVESTRTFVAKEKKLYFQENRHLFEKFKEKIVHIVVDDMPFTSPNYNQVWENEFFQRNAISRGIALLPLTGSDLLVLADLDEIPDPATLARLKRGEVSVDLNILEMDFYYYSLNTKFKIKWELCKIVTFQKYHELNTTCNKIRGMSCPKIPKGGWHLSYFGDKHFIQNKIKNFSHQELNILEYVDVEKIGNRMKNNSDLFGRHIDLQVIKREDNDYLPPLWETFLNKFV